MIEGYTFGRMTVSGRDYQNDLKIIRGRIIGDWLRKKGHELDARDVEDILSAGPSILVVGTGAYGRMQILESTETVLKNDGIELFAEPTSKAAKTFNRLVKEGKDVAGAFHLTC